MKFARKKLRIFGRPEFGMIAVLPFLLFTLRLVQAQTAPAPLTDAQQRERIERQLQELQSLKKDLQRQSTNFDARIRALEAELGATNNVTQGPVAATDGAAATNGLVATNPSAANSKVEEPKMWGVYEPGKGFVLVRAPLGELDFGVLGYLRYLNQLGLKSTYTDSFGRTFDFKQRQDLQVTRMQLMFRGWLFSERFGYNFWTWTQNTSMGDQTQINVGGNAWYDIFDWLTFRGGIFSLPTTRSTSQSFPNWLKVDHRTMSDEYFRASYTTAIMLEGKIPSGFRYKVALGNNLSTLGVDAAQLDNKLNTLATGFWWMPTTKEFGPTMGFGDYEYHTNLATLFGFHYNRSRENQQAQPGANGFENTQLYLSDGTLIFSDNPFNTGGHIANLTYQMIDLEMGYKFKGWSLEGEYYFRRMDDFDTVGNIPVDHVFDHGFQVQGSTMLMQKILQSYVTGAKVWGKYGNPWELGLGLNWFPFHRKEMRVNFQTLYESQSPAGNQALPYQPGARGWLYTLDMGVWF
jgi:hypothetical protein